MCYCAAHHRVEHPGPRGLLPVQLPSAGTPAGQGSYFTLGQLLVEGNIHRIIPILLFFLLFSERNNSLGSVIAFLQNLSTHRATSVKYKTYDTVLLVTYFMVPIVLVKITLS